MRLLIPIGPSFLALLFLVGVVIALCILLTTPRLRAVGLGILAGLLITGIGTLGVVRWLSLNHGPSLLGGYPVAPAGPGWPSLFAETGGDFAIVNAVIGAVAVMGLVGLVLLISHPPTRTFGVALAIVIAIPSTYLGMSLITDQPADSVATTEFTLLQPPNEVMIIPSHAFSQAPTQVARVTPIPPGAPPEPILEADLPRPEWVDQSPGRQGTTNEFIVRSDPKATLEECYQSLSKQVLGAFREYAEAEFEDHFSAYQTPDLKLEGLVQRWWQATQTGDAAMEIWWEPHHSPTPELPEMVNVYARFKIDSDYREQLQDLWRWEVTKDRIGLTSGIAALLVSVLGTLFAYLRLDTATQGYYTRRLQAAALAVILALVGMGYLLIGNAPLMTL